MPKQKPMTEEEQLQYLEQLDPTPKSTPLPPFTEEGRQMPPATGKPMTEEEQLQYLEQLDPTPGAAPKEWLPITELPKHAGDSAKKFFGGLIQAVTNPRESLDTLHDMIDGAALNMMPPLIRDEVLKAHPNLQARIDTANTVAQDKANTYGLKPGNGVMGVLRDTWNSAVTDPFTVAADVSGVPGVGGLAAGVAAKGLRAVGAPGATAAGATANALNKVSDATNPINALTAPIEWVGNKTGITPKLQNAGRNATDAFIVPQNLNPFNGPLKGAPGASAMARNKFMMELAKDPNALKRALDANHEIVQDSPVTAGQAAAGQGDFHRIAAASKKAEGFNPEAEAAITAQADSARVKELQGVGTDHTITPDQIARAVPATPGHHFDPATATLAELEAARDAAKATNYGATDPVLVPTDDRLFEILSLPHNAEVLQRAELLARQNEVPFGDGTTYTPAHTVASSVVGPDGRPVMTNVPAHYPRFSGRDLHHIKEAFDAIASEKKKNNIDHREIASVVGAQEKFLNWVEDPSRLPGYRTAREDHQAWSRLVDRRHAAQVFEDVLTGPFQGENAAAQRATAFANLLDSPRNAVTGNSAVKRATDFKAYDSWADLLTPEDLARLERVKADLARIAKAEVQARKGARYGRKLEEPGKDAVDWKLPPVLNALVTTTNAGLRGIKGDIDGAVAQEISNYLVGPNAPKVTADVLGDAISRKAQVDRFINHLQRGGRTIKRVAPAATNALNAVRERERNNTSR